MFSGKELGRAWSDGLLYAVRTGRPDFGASQRDGGASEFFEYMRGNPDAAARFDESMQAVSTYALEQGSAVSLFDWSCGGRARNVVDVGGGTGTLLGAILARYDGLSGVLFDQEYVLGRSAPVLDAAGPGVRARTTLVPGSFFELASIPVGADVYTLKNILHDWVDAEATTILENVAAVMKPESTIVVLEIVRRERTGHDPFTIDFNDFFDLNMLVTVGGKERSRAEWKVLFAAAGLDLVTIAMGPDGGVSAIEGRLPARTRGAGVRG
jgi:ubiquinone/menaquinone biosynthesis C-methylase UbiE